jgi:MFS family permease
VLTGAVVLLVLFGLVERRAAEPILPLWVFRRRVLIGSNAATLCVGVLLIGLTSYVPLYAQKVLGTSALVAGFAVAALTLGWPLAATLSGRVYLRYGFRSTALLGAAFAIGGTVVLITVDSTSSVLRLAVSCWVIGVGLGFISAPSLVAAQASADWQTRGVVTGANLFARSVGSAIGIAVFGAIVNAAVTGDISDAQHLPPGVLASAIHSVYLGTGAVSLAVIVAILIMPGGVPATEIAALPDASE